MVLVLKKQFAAVQLSIVLKPANKYLWLLNFLVTRVFFISCDTRPPVWLLLSLYDPKFRHGPGSPGPPPSRIQISLDVSGTRFSLIRNVPKSCSLSFSSSVENMQISWHFCIGIDLENPISFSRTLTLLVLPFMSKVFNLEWAVSFVRSFRAQQSIVPVDKYGKCLFSFLSPQGNSP